MAIDMQKLQRLQQLRQQPQNLVEDPALVAQDEVVAPVQPVQPVVPQQEQVVSPTSGQPVIPQAARKLEEAMAFEQEAVLRGAQAGAAQAAAESSLLAETAKRQEEMAAQQREQALQQEKVMQEQITKLDTKINEISNTKIDPDRIWKNRSTGQKITTGIGLFLGAFGAARGGGNTAVKVIENAIDQDIKAQMADIQNQRSGAQQQQTLVQQMNQSFGNMRQAEEAARIAALNTAQLRTQQVAAQYKAPMVQAQAQQLYAQLEQKKQASIAAFEQQAAAQAAEKQRMDILAKQQEGGQAPTLPQASEFVNTVLKDEGERKEARKELGKVREAQKIVNRVDEIVNKANVAGVMDALQSEKLKGEILKEVDLYIRSIQKTPAEGDSEIRRFAALMDRREGKAAVTAEDIRQLVNNAIINLTDTPVLSGYNIKPQITMKTQQEVDKAVDDQTTFSNRENTLIDGVMSKRGVNRDRAIELLRQANMLK